MAGLSGDLGISVVGKIHSPHLPVWQNSHQVPDSPVPIMLKGSVDCPEAATLAEAMWQGPCGTAADAWLEDRDVPTYPRPPLSDRKGFVLGSKWTGQVVSAYEGSLEQIGVLMNETRQERQQLKVPC